MWKTKSIKAWFRKHKENIVDFSFGLPALLFFAIFTYYPIINLFKISLTDWNLTRPTSEFVGLANYRWLFTGPGKDKFFNSLKVTLIYATSEVILTIILGIALAVLFNRMTKSFNWMRTAVVLPKYILVASSAMIFLWLYNDQFGVLNYVLQLLGRDPINWLGSRNSALWSLIWFTAWRSIGYSMLIYLSAMKGISEQYLEAAKIDGANAWQQLIHIRLPLLAPTTLFLFVTTAVSSMKVFQAVDVLTQGGPYGATNVLVYNIYEMAFVNNRLDRAAAMGVVFFVILLLFTVITMKWSNNKVNYDA